MGALSTAVNGGCERRVVSNWVRAADVKGVGACNEGMLKECKGMMNAFRFLSCSMHAPAQPCVSRHGCVCIEAMIRPSDDSMEG
jgi:hypothetical protein